MLLASTSVGIGILSKGTVYFYGLPFLIWLGVVFIRRRWLNCWPRVLSAAVLVFVLNAGVYARNTSCFGNPFGMDISEHPTTHSEISLPSIISGILRHTAAHAVTGVPHVDGLTERGIRFLHNVVGADVNDKRTTFHNARYETPRLTRHEDTAPNPLHLVGIFLCVPVLLLSRKSGFYREQREYLLCVAGTCFLFCAIVRWQVHIGRLHLPAFLLITPLMAPVLADTSCKWITRGIAALLLLLSLPYVMLNETRPLVGRRSIFCVPRIDQYVTITEMMPPSWTGAVEFVVSRNVRSVGLLVPLHFREYAVWAILDEVGESTPRMEFVAVSNSSSNLCRNPRYGEFIPDAIIAIRRELPGSYREDTSLNYVEAWGKDDARVYVLENTP
jgi:hypothetical protein